MNKVGCISARRRISVQRSTFWVTLLVLGAGVCQAQTNRVTGIRFWSIGDTTRVAIEVSGEFKFKWDRLAKPDRLFFDLANTTPGDSSTIAVGDGLLKQIRIAENRHGVTRVVLDLEEGVEFSSSQLSNPERLMVELRSKNPRADAPPGSEQPGPPTTTVSRTQTPAAVSPAASPVTQPAGPAKPATPKLVTRPQPGTEQSAPPAATASRTLTPADPENKPTAPKLVTRSQPVSEQSAPPTASASRTPTPADPDNKPTAPKLVTRPQPGSEQSAPPTATASRTLTPADPQNEPTAPKLVTRSQPGSEQSAPPTASASRTLTPTDPENKPTAPKLVTRPQPGSEQSAPPAATASRTLTPADPENKPTAPKLVTRPQPGSEQSAPPAATASRTLTPADPQNEPTAPKLVTRPQPGSEQSAPPTATASRTQPAAASPATRPAEPENKPATPKLVTRPQTMPQQPPTPAQTSPATQAQTTRPEKAEAQRTTAPVPSVAPVAAATAAAQPATDDATAIALARVTAPATNSIRPAPAASAPKETAAPAPLPKLSTLASEGKIEPPPPGKPAPDQPTPDQPTADSPTPAADDLPEPRAAVRNSNGDRSLTRVLGLKLGTVVIDAGHGGHDQGTHSKSGLLEKDLVLDISKRLAALLRTSTGTEVIMTRTDDTYLSLEDRTRIANDAHADLFLSVHVNSSPLKSVGGVEAYFLNFSASREDLDLATRENATADSTIFDFKDVVSKIALRAKIDESREFAVQLQKVLQKEVAGQNKDAKDRGVKRAPFVVLIGAEMPAVLAEVGFVSNARDEELLETDEHRDRIAEALFEGITAYAKTLSESQVARAEE